MPVLGVDDEGAARSRRRNLAVDQRDHLGRRRDVQRALRIGEIVLDVDDDQGRSPVVSIHRSSVSQDPHRPRRWFLCVMPVAASRARAGPSRPEQVVAVRDACGRITRPGRLSAQRADFGYGSSCDIRGIGPAGVAAAVEIEVETHAAGRHVHRTIVWPVVDDGVV